MKDIYIGTDDFKKLIESNGYYVDKTKIIEELFKNKSEATLFPRPRRFGKTLTMSMLDNFFNIEKNSEHLFKGLYIEKTEYYKEMNKYPVIFLTFKELKKDTYEEVYNSYIELIVNLYESKRYIYNNLSISEKQYFDLITERSANKSQYEKAIVNLSIYLEKYYNEKVIILIDEYDIPIQNGYLKGYYDDVVSLIRNVFDTALKTNPSLKFSILTGVLRVSKETILSGLNNLKVYGLMNSNFGEFFGFTELETKELLEYYNLELTEEVKNMYDGYNFNGVNMYNPWSIINYAHDKILDNYWINTSSNNLIINMLSDTTNENKVVIEKLVQGESVNFVFNDKLTYKDFDDHNNLNTILNLLYSSGYLTFDKEIDTIDGKFSYLRIPNMEVKELIAKLMTEEVYGSNASEMPRKIIKAINDYDKTSLEELINMLLKSRSYMDGKEEFYHGFVLGLFSTCLNNKNYKLKSNRESGLGRYDILLSRTDGTYGYIMEFKVANSDDDMEKLASEGLDQIDKKEYYQELIEDKVRDLRKLVIVFKGKSAIVR